MTAQAEGRPSQALKPVDAVLLALVPGTCALLAGFGAGVLANLLWAAPAALLAESVARRVAGQDVHAALRDRSTLLVALLLSVSLPPASPWWLAAGAALVAVGVARRLHDGRGGTLFNPTMLAYALLLICFPREMSRWLVPDGAAAAAPVGLWDALLTALGMMPVATLDGFTMATPLEVIRQDTTHTVAELRALQPQFGSLAGRGWERANAGFLAGGLWLVHRGTIDWRAPAGLLLSVGTLALLNDDGSSASGGPLLFHLFGGGTMLAGFFILTDPGSSSRSPQGRMLGGIFTGALVYLMRSSGGWPDGIAFAVLATNALTPVLDRLFLPPVPRDAVAPGRLPQARHLCTAARIAMLAALLTLNWRGLEPGRLEADTVTTALLAELGDSGYTRITTFSVQDAALLGLPAARMAWRLDGDRRPAAVVLPLVAHEGYGGPLDLLLAVDEAGHVLAVRVTRHAESPGFSDPLDASGLAWLRAFAGHTLAGTRWALRRDAGDFDAFTGATVTPRAVVAAVRSGLQYFAEHRTELLAAPQETPDDN